MIQQSLMYNTCVNVIIADGWDNLLRQTFNVRLHKQIKINIIRHVCEHKSVVVYDIN